MSPMPGFIITNSPLKLSTTPVIEGIVKGFTV